MTWLMFHRVGGGPHPEAGVLAAGEGAGQDARGREAAGERPQRRRWSPRICCCMGAAAHERRQQRVQQAAVGHHVEDALQHVQRRDRADARVLCKRTGAKFFLFFISPELGRTSNMGIPCIRTNISHWPRGDN